MKIISNNIGNYGPGYVNRAKTNQVRPNAQSVEPTEVKTVKAESLRTESLRTDSLRTDSLRTENLRAEGNKAAGITNDEKNFFMNLYPDQANEIVDYHYYQKSGKMSGVTVGSLFDRRG